METSSLITKLTQLQSALTLLHEPTEQGSSQAHSLSSHQAALYRIVSRIREELKTMEAALSNQRSPNIPFQAILEQLPIAILLSEPETDQYRWANPAFHKLLGYSENQLLHRSWHTIVRLSTVSTTELNRYEGSIQTQAGQVLSGRFTQIPLNISTHEVVYQMTLIEIIDRRSPYDSVDQVLLQQLKSQVQQQKQLRQTFQAVRQSLDLKTVFSTSVQEIGQFLQADWVLLTQYHARQHLWQPVTQYSTQGQPLHELHLPEKLLKLAPLLQSQRPIRINLAAAETTPTYPVWLSHFPGSWLIVPIHLPPHLPKQRPVLWGVMALGYQRFSALWDSTQEMFAETIVQEVTIAIQQSLLYQQLQQANKELQELALTDSLTQISNRRQFDLHLESEWQRLAREQQPLSLILCDIDFFKRYNDHYGHPTGDHCLLQVAQALVHASKRPADLVARYGGEEFAVILPNTNTQGAYRVAHKIHQGIANLQITHPDSELSPWLTVTIGVATAIPNRDLTAQELLQAADLALYHAKQQGRDRTYIHAHYIYPPAAEVTDRG